MKFSRAQGALALFHPYDSCCCCSYQNFDLVKVYPCCYFSEQSILVFHQDGISLLMNEHLLIIFWFWYLLGYSSWLPWHSSYFIQALLLLMAWSQILLEGSCWKYCPCLFPSYNGGWVWFFSGNFDKNYIMRSQPTASTLVFEWGKFLGKLFVIGECGKPRNSLCHRMKPTWNRVCCWMGLSPVRFGWERLATAELLPHHRFFPTLYIVASVAYWKLLFFYLFPHLSLLPLLLCDIKGDSVRLWGLPRGCSW